MNSLTKTILQTVFKRCNLPDRVVDGLSLPVSESRFSEYHSSDISTRLEFHDQIMHVESEVAGLTLSFISSGFEDVPILERIEVANARVLLEYCKEPIISDMVEKACDLINVSAIELPDWAVPIKSEANLLWKKGKLAYGCDYKNPERLLDSLKVVSWFGETDNVVNIDIRTLSAQLFADSKRLESINSVVSNLFKTISPDEIQSFKADELLSYWGISKFPAAFRFKADLMLKTMRGEFDVSKAWPSLQIPSDGIEGVSAINRPDYVLFIENKTTFERYTREINDNGWIFYTNGFPSRVWQRLFKQVISLVDDQTPVYHWGDVDIGGYRILVFMTHLLGRDITPYMMLPDKDSKSSHKINKVELMEVLNSDTSNRLAAFKSAVSDIINKSETIYRIEQELLSVASPLQR